MEKVKIFYDVPSMVEDAVNKWSKENGNIEITRAIQSQAGGINTQLALVLTIFYKEKKK